MGRTFESVRHGEKLAKLAKMHLSEGFISCDDALEAVLFSVLVELIKRQENLGYSSVIPDNEYQKDGVLSLKYWT